MAAPMRNVLVKSNFLHSSNCAVLRSAILRRNHVITCIQSGNQLAYENVDKYLGSSENLQKRCFHLLTADLRTTSPLKRRPRDNERPAISGLSRVHCVHYSRERERFSDSNHSRSSQESSGNLSLALGIGGFTLASVALAFNFWHEDKKETIEKMIARAVIAERENRLVDADSFYHQATVMCEKENNTQALLYTYDQMANFNMRHGRLMKAENLFKETLKLLISSGMPREDPAVVEISLKLAKIFERMGRNDEAETGFQWCIETSENLLTNIPAESDEQRMNLTSLLGMCLDSYARFLGVTNRLAQAEKLYKRALAICEGDLKVDGTPHPQTIILLNDLGTICDMQGHYDDAVGHVSRALELAEQGSLDVLPTILCNLASMKMHKGLKSEAKALYERALKLAQKTDDREAVLIIRANLQKVL